MKHANMNLEQWEKFFARQGVDGTYPQKIICLLSAIFLGVEIRILTMEATPEKPYPIVLNKGAEIVFIIGFIG